MLLNTSRDGVCWTAMYQSNHHSKLMSSKQSITVHALCCGQINENDLLNSSWNTIPLHVTNRHNALVLNHTPTNDSFSCLPFSRLFAFWAYDTKMHETGEYWVLLLLDALTEESFAHNLLRSCDESLFVPICFRACSRELTENTANTNGYRRTSMTCIPWFRLTTFTIRKYLQKTQRR